MLASNAAEAGGFLHSRAGLARPDLQMTFMVGLKDNPRTLPRRHGFVLHVAVLRPATRGRLELPWGSRRRGGADLRTEASATYHLQTRTGALFGSRAQSRSRGAERRRAGSLHSRQCRDDLSSRGHLQDGTAA